MDSTEGEGVVIPSNPFGRGFDSHHLHSVKEL